MAQSARVLTCESVKALLHDHRTREDVLEAVLACYEASGGGHPMDDAAALQDLVRIFRWAGALNRLLETEGGQFLLASYRRANALVAGQDHGGVARCDDRPDPRLYLHREEREMAIAIAVARREVAAAQARADFDQAMREITLLRPFIQAFFSRVPVETGEPDQRQNRLRLLNELRGVLCSVADFSKIEG
ncbi:MAG: hypothetical protein IRZ09_03680 [Variibacter sp.]|nr:hypothetical protein [Variibacter sp.]